MALYENGRAGTWRWTHWWLTIALALAAAVTVGFGMTLIVGREDSEALESPLFLAIARQLHAGPWELYGPYDASNLLVLIHAPLYYHLSALLAWPLVRLGVDSIAASMIIGRAVSLLGLAATAALAHRLARLDGAPVRTGVWAALLLAGAPILGSMPYTVRPDMLGIAFQTAGVLLVLEALRGRARLREGEAPSEPPGKSARTEPRPPGMAQSGELMLPTARTEPRPPRIGQPGEAMLRMARTEPRPPGIAKACTGDEPGRAGRRVLAAFVAFALAFCTKQHFVVPAVISTVLLLSERRRGRVSFKHIERGLLLAFAIVLVLFGAEELMTGGRMSRAVFLAGRSVGSVHPGSWDRAEIVFIATAVDSKGLLALLAAAAFAVVWLFPGCGPRALGATGAILIGLVLALSSSQLWSDSLWLTVAILSTLGAIAPFWLAASVYRGWRPTVGERLDGFLWLYFLGEMTLVSVLYCASTGAWVNYAIQAVVFLAVLTARGVERVLEARLPLRSQALIAAAALVCASSAGSAVRFAELRRRVDREALKTFLQKDGCPGSVVFVVDHPGMNRLHGRLDLVYDEWLYPVFEAIGLAQPRAIWLRRILSSGTIQFVVNTSDAPRLDGIPQTLTQMGYFRKYQVGPFYVWERGIRAAGNRGRAVLSARASGFH